MPQTTENSIGRSRWLSDTDTPLHRAVGGVLAVIVTILCRPVDLYAAELSPTQEVVLDVRLPSGAVPADESVFEELAVSVQMVRFDKDGVPLASSSPSWAWGVNHKLIVETPVLSQGEDGQVDGRLSVKVSPTRDAPYFGTLEVNLEPSADAEGDFVLELRRQQKQLLLVELRGQLENHGVAGVPVSLWEYVGKDSGERVEKERKVTDGDGRVRFNVTTSRNYRVGLAPNVPKQLRAVGVDVPRGEGKGPEEAVVLSLDTPVCIVEVVPPDDRLKVAVPSGLQVDQIVLAGVVEDEKELHVYGAPVRVGDELWYFGPPASRYIIYANPGSRIRRDYGIVELKASDDVAKEERSEDGETSSPVRRRVSLVERKPLTLSFNVTDSVSSSPVTGAAVVVVSDDSDGEVVRLRPDDEGAVQIEGLQSPTVTVVVRAYGYQKWEKQIDARKQGLEVRLRRDPDMEQKPDEPLPFDPVRE